MNLPAENHASTTNSGSRANPRGRWVLLLVAALFLGPILIAGVFGRLGVHPNASANKGEALKPYVDLRAAVLHRADGSAFAWNPGARQWRIAVLPNAVQCAGEKAAACQQLAADLDKVRLLFGDDARRLQVLWMGALPRAVSGAIVQLQDDAKLRALLPHADDANGVPVYLIDPYGFVVMRYAPGFAPRDLHDDLARLLKLM